MGKIKNYYLEIVCGIFLSFSVLYFAYNFYYSKRNEVFLMQAKSKLLLLEARANRLSAEKLHEAENNSCKECFENVLNESGFKVHNISKKTNYISAVVTKSSEAENQLQAKLDNIKIIPDSDDKVEIRWFYNSSTKVENIIEDTNIVSFKLNAICFFKDNDWQAWINGKMYDAHNTKIDQNSEIKSVKSNQVIINCNNKEIILNLD